MKFKLVLFYLFITIGCHAQDFDGFIVIAQNQDTVRGYMRMLLDGKGRKILITDDKKKTPETYYIKDLSSYALKKDTFSLLNAFYPFEEEDYLAQDIEAKILIGKGKLRLYYATFPGYTKSWGAPTTPTYSPTQPYTPGGRQVYSEEYETYIVECREKFYGIKKKDFISTMEKLVGNDESLFKKIKAKKLKYKDTEEIIRIYNSNRFRSY